MQVETEQSFTFEFTNGRQINFKAENIHAALKEAVEYCKDANCKIVRLVSRT